MSISTLGGSANVSERVADTIQRRGATGSGALSLWSSLAGAGAILAIVAMFVDWYAAVRTATAWYSGFIPPTALFLITAAGALLVAKAVNLIPQDQRIKTDLFAIAVFASGAILLMLRHVWKDDLHNAVYLLAVPLVGLLLALVPRSATGLGTAPVDRIAIPMGILALLYIGYALIWGDITRAVVVLVVLGSVVILALLAGFRPSRETIELEQVALTLATIGTGLVLFKRVIDPEYATSGWLWGLFAGIAVLVAALAACQYLGILSMFQVMLFMGLAISVFILIVLLAQVIGDGWPVLSENLNGFWEGTLRSRSEDDRLGISQGILGSFWIAAFVVVIAFPIGIAAAVYLEEYAPRNKLTGALDIIVRNLAGVPSVVYGLLGLFLFVKGTAVTHWFIDRINSFWARFFDDDSLIDIGQSSLFAGGVTLAILVLPIIIITAAEAVRAVPQSLREGAYGVGATKWEVIRSQVLPFAAPGILTGTLLALARAVGEAAPLILVGAITGRLAPRDSMFSGLETFFGQFADRFTAMPIIIVGWVRNAGVDEGFGPAAGAAIVMLLVFVILMNSVAVLLRNYFEKKRA